MPKDKLTNWKCKKLSELCVIKYGKDHQNLNDGDIPVYGSGGIMRYVDTAIFDKKSVLIPRKGTLGNLFLVNPPFWTVDTLFWTDINTKEVDIDFLFYNLHTKKLAELNVGTAVPSLTTALLNDLEITLPNTLLEQESIALTLSCLDDKIELNAQMNKTLEEMAQAIFKSWFVDFDPFKDGEFEDSELGKIPKGWKVGKLSDHINFIKGKKPTVIKHEATEETSLLYLTIGVMENKEQLFTNDINSILCTEKDIIMVMDGASSGRLYLGINGAISSTCSKILNSSTDIDQYTLFHILKEYESYIMLHTTGSAIPHTDKGLILNLNFFLPPQEVLKDFEKTVKPMYEKIKALQKEINKLITTRDYLLPKLMSGEIRVPLEKK